MTLSEAAVDIDDNVVDPSNGDCMAVSFRPTQTPSSSVGAESAPSQLVHSNSGDSTTRRAAVAALSVGDAPPRPAAEVTSTTASSVAEEEERELFILFTG